jgi:hypothetical protein
VSDRPSSPDHPPSSKRPFSVTILAMVVLIFTTLNFLRVFSAIRNWKFLATLPVGIPFAYLAATGLIWTIVGISLAVGLFFGRRWSLRLAKVTWVIYTVYYWLDRLLMAESGAIWVRWPFALGLTAALWIFTFWVLSRPKTHTFLKKSRD